MSASAGERPEEVPAGLCARCVHRRIIENDRDSRFVLCRLSASDPAYPRYPALPVRACDGFAAGATDSASGPADDDPSTG